MSKVGGGAGALAVKDVPFQSMWRMDSDLIGAARHPRCLFLFVCRSEMTNSFLAGCVVASSSWAFAISLILCGCCLPVALGGSPAARACSPRRLRCCWQ